MKNKKALRAASISSFVTFCLFVIMGLKTLGKYCNSVKDWHYIAALIGSILCGCLALVSVVGFILTFRLDDKHS